MLVNFIDEPKLPVERASGPYTEYYSLLLALDY